MDKETFYSMLKYADNGCLEWTGYTMPKPGHPYGRLRFDGKKELAHRIAYLLKNGSIPDGLCVLHACDNPKCCNPEHLWVGTRADNSLDMDKKGRRRAVGNKCKGSQCHSAKITENDVIMIRKLRDIGKTTVEIGKMYGLNPAGISRICTRKIWTHVQ